MWDAEAWGTSKQANKQAAAEEGFALEASGVFSW